MTSVSDRDPNALREMKRMGLVPGTGLIVQSENAARDAAGSDRRKSTHASEAGACL